MQFLYRLKPVGVSLPTIMKCDLCQNETLYKFLDLGHQPPSDAFLKEEDLNKPEIFYPLQAYFCETCNLVQLGYSVDPKILFSEYVYTTGMTNELVKNFNGLVDALVHRFNLTKDDLVIDIGSNDGTLLKFYVKYNIKILGVEPSTVADIAIKNKIPTVNKFFNHETASEIAKKNGKAKVITATNIFAHVKDLPSFIKGISEILTEDGVFVTESHHLLSLLANMQWDSIYHEHLRVYSLKSLIYLFNIFNMDIFDAEKISTHGGSIRAYACKRGTYKKSDNICRLLQEEEKAGLFSKQTYKKFQKKVLQHKIKIQEILINIKKSGKKIIGVGAPAKGNTLLNYCNITPDIMDYIVEKSTLKIGLYTPGTHIKVVDEKFLYEDQPDYTFLLSWNIADELIPKLKNSGYKGKIIVPIPTPHIVK